MNIIQAARELRSEHFGSNPEYDRALVELTAHVLGIANDDDRPYVEALVLAND